MKILIILCCLVLAYQYPPVKAYVNQQIQGVHQKLDSRDQKSQEKQDKLKDQYLTDNTP